MFVCAYVLSSVTFAKICTDGSRSPVGQRCLCFLRTEETTGSRRARVCPHRRQTQSCLSRLVGAAVPIISATSMEDTSLRGGGRNRAHGDGVSVGSSCHH